METLLSINGLEVAAQYDDGAIDEVFLPFLRDLTRRRRAMDGRMIVFLAAPPATGKSTLAAFLEKLSRETAGIEPVQALGMDGFHYHQDYILAHTVRKNGEEIPMRLIKGAPESFDVQKLRRALEWVRGEDVRWPLYDRRIHDVVEEAIPVTGSILLVEGNWLLLRDAPWAALPRDATAFIRADAKWLRDRLIDRKMRGGYSREEAEAHCLRSDLPNVERCLKDSMSADWQMEMTAEGGYRLI